MASVTDDAPGAHGCDFPGVGTREFSRLERMLLFAVISECERCICSEGCDCFEAGKSVSCPFVPIREEYSVMDIVGWKEVVR
jgi:hypothetical protein